MASRKEGITLGPYRIIEQVGEGGMATVYKAFQASMDRYVALKILPEHYARDGKFVERFIREARTIARLEHQNILPVYDFGEENGITYMAMRFMEGGTLKEVLSSARLTYDDISHILGGICAALDYAHRHGVVHRDVKPANVMIDREGGVYLTDFGIAKVLEGTSELTATGAAIGTPAYMAPEQSMGMDVDARTDIYAVGVILYELLTGTPPYRADTPMAVALAHIHEPLPLPHEREPNIPEVVERVVLKSLSKEAEGRYQSAAELADAFNAAVAESGVDRGQTTLGGLATSAYDARTRDAIPVENLPPSQLETLAMHAEEPRRKGVPGWVWIAGLAVIIVIGAVLLLSRILPLTGQDSGTVPAAEDLIAENSSPAAPIVEDVIEENSSPTTPANNDNFYDAFDDPAYDGRFNDQMWYQYGGESCDIQQGGGILTFTRTDPASGEECGLGIKPPGLMIRGSDLDFTEARWQIGDDHTPPTVESNLRYWVNLPDGEWQYILCGLFVDGPDKIDFLFDVVDSRQGSIHSEFVPHLSYNQWYTARMEIDPTTMEFSCFANGELVGSYVPDNADQLREAQFEVGFHTWFSEGAMATIQADDAQFGTSQ